MFTPMLKEGLDCHQETDAVGDVRPAGSPRRLGLSSDGDCAQAHEEEHRNDRDHTDKSQLLRQHRKQEVVVGFRQVEELLHSFAQPHSEPAAAADSDLRLRELESASEGIGPRVGEGKKTVENVGFVQGERAQARRGGKRRAQADDQRRPAEIEHPERRGQKHRGGAVVRLENDERGNREQDADRHQTAPERSPGLRRAPSQISRKVEDDAELHGLRRLEGQGPDTQPSPAFR